MIPNQHQLALTKINFQIAVNHFDLLALIC